MLIWSPFILDELAGLRNDALPTCAECGDNPRFLVENSGFVPRSAAVRAPSRRSTARSRTSASAPEPTPRRPAVRRVPAERRLRRLAEHRSGGMFPMRTGTADASRQLRRGLDGWSSASTSGAVRRGLQRRRRHHADRGTTNFRRWGFEDGYGALVSSLYTSLDRPADPQPPCSTRECRPRTRPPRCSAEAERSSRSSGETRPIGRPGSAREGGGAPFTGPAGRPHRLRLRRPALLVVLVVVAVPIVWNIALSFQDLRLVDLQDFNFFSTDVSLDNYREVTSGDFRGLLLRTFGTPSPAPRSPCSRTWAAWWCARRSAGRRLVRGLLLFPYVVPVVAAACCGGRCSTRSTASSTRGSRASAASRSTSCCRATASCSGSRCRWRSPSSSCSRGGAASRSPSCSSSPASRRSRGARGGGDHRRGHAAAAVPYVLMPELKACSPRSSCCASSGRSTPSTRCSSSPAAAPTPSWSASRSSTGCSGGQTSAPRPRYRSCWRALGSRWRCTSVVLPQGSERVNRNAVETRTLPSCAG